MKRLNKFFGFVGFTEIFWGVAQRFRAVDC